jgi:NADH dehydrogenase FAD-containing subunit
MRGICDLQTGESKLNGVFVWVIWAAFHLQLIAEPTQAVSVLCQWVWTYLTSQLGFRPIVKRPCD